MNISLFMENIHLLWFYFNRWSNQSAGPKWPICPHSSTQPVSIRQKHIYLFQLIVAEFKKKAN